MDTVPIYICMSVVCSNTAVVCCFFFVFFFSRNTEVLYLSIPPTPKLNLTTARPRHAYMVAAHGMQLHIIYHYRFLPGDDVYVYTLLKL